MYAFEIFFSALSPQGVDHGKGKKLSLAENFFDFLPEILLSLHNWRIGGVRLGTEIKIFFSLPLIAEKFEVWHPLFFIF